jgi:hypothetical protein
LARFADKHRKKPLEASNGGVREIDMEELSKRIYELRKKVEELNGELTPEVFFLLTKG